MDMLLPVLSGSLRDVIKTIVNKTQDPIATELLEVDKLVEDYNAGYFALSDTLRENIVNNIISPRITNEVRMLSVRVGDFEISFLPEGKDPEYSTTHSWSRKNRQTGKPAKIIQKLLTKQFKTREWEIFTNLFKAELCQCNQFELVSGEDIRTWYDESNYYKLDGTLGNSCMRYSHAQPYFDIYVDNAKMLITKKDGLLTGRALVWEVDGVTIMDRIYTCFDYLENCFIDYAKENKWWIRESNSLLSSGETQEWYSPDDNYEDVVSRTFEIKLPKEYLYYPYMDSFRYFDESDLIICTAPEYYTTLDFTDGTLDGEVYVCDRCGTEFYGRHGDVPDDLRWSDYCESYYCSDCCWYCDALDDYICISDEPVDVHTKYGIEKYPDSYISDYLVADVDGTESKNDIVEINGEYYFITDKVTFNPDTKEYELV